MQLAFDQLKAILANSPVLATPTRDDVYLVDVDSSCVGAGAVLRQWQGGKLRVIEFASRTYNSTEWRYCVTRLEMLALIFALRQWKQ
jgi:RNase H-like domain found in reverse transcriptase